MLKLGLRMARSEMNPCSRIEASRSLAALGDGQVVAGTGQSGVQVGRRKPVIQGGPAGEILSGWPGAGFGRDEPKRSSS